MFVCHSVVLLISGSITFRSTECGGQKDDPRSSLGMGRGGVGDMTDGTWDMPLSSLMTSGGINQVFIDFTGGEQVLLDNQQVKMKL